MPITQPNDEIDRIYHSVNGGWMNQSEFKEAIQRLIAEARIDENENWARHIGAAWDNEVVNHEDIHKRLNELQASLNTKQEGK